MPLYGAWCQLDLVVSHYEPCSCWWKDGEADRYKIVTVSRVMHVRRASFSCGLMKLFSQYARTVKHVQDENSITGSEERFNGLNQIQRFP